MSKLPKLTGKELCLILERLDFVHVRTTGSHMLYQHADGRHTVVPCHAGQELGPGLLTKIIKKDFLLTREIFLSLLKK